MKTFLAVAAVSLALPVSAFAQPMVQTQTVICTVADIQNAVGVCSKIEMPQPPTTVRVQVRPVVKTISVTNAGLGGLGAQGFGLLALGFGAVAAAVSGSSNGTNGTN